MKYCTCLLLNGGWQSSQELLVGSACKKISAHEHCAKLIGPCTASRALVSPHMRLSRVFVIHFVPQAVVLRESTATAVLSRTRVAARVQRYAPASSEALA